MAYSPEMFLEALNGEWATVYKVIDRIHVKYPFVKVTDMTAKKFLMQLVRERKAVCRKSGVGPGVTRWRLR